MSKQESIDKMVKGLEKLSSIQKKANAMEKIKDALIWLGTHPGKWTTPKADVPALKSISHVKPEDSLFNAAMNPEQLKALEALKKRQLIAGSGIAGAGALGAGGLGAAALSGGQV